MHAFFADHNLLPKLYRAVWQIPALLCFLAVATAQPSGPLSGHDSAPAPGLAESLLSDGNTNHGAVAETHLATRPAWQFLVDSNDVPPKAQPAHAVDYQAQLEAARHQRLVRLFEAATATFAGLLRSDAPESIKRSSLFELAQIAQDQNDLARAQQIYAQYLERWPRDVGVPDLLLRQGLVYRQMGLPSMAITKFYAVMSSALVLKPESFDDYQRLVLRAQNEVAQTQFDLGRWGDAEDAFKRLLKLEAPPANRSTIEYKLIQCLVAVGKHSEAIGQAQDFLERYPEAPERSEIHFLCASSLKLAHRDADAFREVISLLREQSKAKTPDPQTVAYWQRRAGNEIANEFYRDGDFMKALDIYLTLADLGTSPDWQLPAWYQIGLVFERLKQPGKATDYYGKIVDREKQVSTNAPPSLKALVEMAKWRKDFLGWQLKTELVNADFHTAFGSAKTNAVSN